MIYLVGVAAAVFLGLGFVLQQHAAATAPPGDFLRLRLLLDLLRKPLWLAGVASMIVGQILSTMALASADVSLVEPLLTANLLFALVLARLLYRQGLGRREWVGSLLLSAGVGIFLWAGDPTGGDPDGDSLLRWTLAIGILLVAQLCVVEAKRRGGEARPMLLAGAAGLLFGVQDGLTRRATSDWQAGIVRIFLHWTPYALIAIGVVSMVLAQSAFESGRLRTTLPMITATEPLAGIAIGVVVFGEHLRLGSLSLVGEACGLAAIVIGVIMVGTSRNFVELEQALLRHKLRLPRHRPIDLRLAHDRRLD
ncbi:MAG: DMT family transporter [Acidothermus sp.]|nr:DMT family transporter [Acidothermus sp.]MCL6537537.1 DMT family transporter [Acidothermus sp.]